MKKLILTMAAIVAVFTLSAQEKGDFKMTGKPIITIFSNYNSGIGSESDNSPRGFEFDRVYLGYKTSLTKEWNAEVVFDIGSTGLDDASLEMVAYLKKAALTWKRNNLKISFGMIGTNTFKVQESFWGYRYIWKSFMDQYKLGSSADIGVSGSYTFNDWLSADASIINGEGYKKVNVGQHQRYTLGVTAKPTDWLLLRIYGDTFKDNDYHTAQTLAFFAGYTNKYFKIGAEYNLQFEENEMPIGATNPILDSEVNGFSIYGTGNICDKFNVFARYDDYNESDKSRYIVGVEYKINKFIKLSPNYQVSNQKGVSGSEKFIYLSLQFKL